MKQYGLFRLCICNRGNASKLLGQVCLLIRKYQIKSLTNYLQHVFSSFLHEMVPLKFIKTICTYYTCFLLFCYNLKYRS